MLVSARSSSGVDPFFGTSRKSVIDYPAFSAGIIGGFGTILNREASLAYSNSDLFRTGGSDRMLHTSSFSRVLNPLLWQVSVVTFLWVVLLSITALGQNQGGTGQTKQYPAQEYYLAVSQLENGELEEALAGFREASQRAWRIGNIRFVDSIAPLVMAGECYYQQGNLTLALQQYEAAMTLQIELGGWSTRLNGNGLGGVGANNNSATMRGIQWGTSRRGAIFVSLPKFVPCTIGQLDTVEAVRRGGVVIPAEVIRIDVGEVLRTLALAQYRRNQILGPLAPKYPISVAFQTAIQGEQGSGISWVDAGFRVNQGLAEQAIGDNARAQQILAASQSSNDRLDHPVTPLALLAQAQIQTLDKNYPSAAQLLLESSLSAAQMEQYLLLGDITQSMGAVGCLLTDASTVNTLQAIANWSRKQRRIPLCYSLASASELAANVGNVAASDTLGKTALAATRSRGVFLPRVVAQVAYASALADFSRGQIAPGNAAMATAMTFYRGSNATGVSSILQYRLNQTLDLHRRDVLSVDEARKSIESILGEDASTWAIEPLESLTLLQSDQSTAWNLYDDLSMRRNATDEYPDIYEQRAQRRFFQVLPWKHRLFAARQLILAREEQLTQAQLNLRKKLLLRIPELGPLSQKRNELLSSISQQKIAWERIEHPKNELLQFKDLETVSSKLESLFHVLAISRIALPELLLESNDVSALRAKLRENEAVLRFVLVPTEQGVRLDAFVLSKTTLERFEIGPALDLQKKLVKLLTTLGLGKDKNRKLILDDFKLYEEAAAELRDGLFPDNLRGVLDQYTQWVIVPEGWVWYVPFALLPVDESDGPRWIEKRDIAFSPTVSLANHCFNAVSRKVALDEKLKTEPDAKWEGALWNAAFFGGVDEKEEAERAVAFETEVPGMKVLQPIKEIIPVHLYRVRPTLLLAACRAIENATTLDSAWFQHEPSKARLTWNDTLLSPMATSEVLLVPGWSSSAATLNLGNGDDLFLPAIAMLTSGTKQGLLNRWSGAGTASQSLLKRYLQESNEHAPLEAWRRALTVLWAEEVPPAQEDVLKGAEFAKALMPGSHAVLWSGYIPIGQWLDSQPPK